ncbi:Ankyrin repeat and SOCS box protein 2, partial [Colletotrichum shisoi]
NMTLDKLPSELLMHIATHFDTPESDVVLALVSRRLLDVFKPRLYHAAISADLPDITVVAATKGNLETLKVAATYGAQFRGKYALPPMGCVVDDWRLEHYKIHQMEGDTPVRQNSIARLLLASGASYHNVHMPNRFHKYPLFSMVGSPNNANRDEFVLSYHEMKRRIFGLDEGNGLLDQDDFGPQEEDSDGDAGISPSIPLLQTTDGTPELAETEDLVEMVSYVDPYSVPALHTAASSGAKAIMAYLVKNVVLHYAAFAPQHSNAVNKALSLGADPRAEFSCTMDMFGQQSFDALDWAIHFRVEQAVDALLAWPGCDLAWCHMPGENRLLDDASSQSRYTSQPLKESRIKHMFRILHTGNSQRYMTPEWRYRAQCFEMFSSRLLSATAKQGTGKSRKKYLPFHRELEMAFFWALQTDSLENEEFSWINFDRFDLDEIVSVQSYDENLMNQWALSWNAVPNPFTESFCSIGTLALYSVVAGKADSDLQAKRIRWLLNAGAKPCPPGRETEMFSPIRHLLHSIEPCQNWTSNERQSYLERVTAVVNLLAAANGWDGFATGNSEEHDGEEDMAEAPTVTKPKLPSLPTEILQDIAELVSDACGRAGLARASRRLCQVTDPILWRHGVQDNLSEMLVQASTTGNLDILKKSVIYGADIDRPHHVPLPEEAEEYYSELPLSKKDKDYLFWAAPLHLAVYHGHYDAVKWLVSYGADIEAPGYLVCECKGYGDYLSDDGDIYKHSCWTPLHYSICREQDSIIRLLLSAGASVQTMVSADKIRIDDRFDKILRGLRPKVFRSYCTSLSSNVTALHTASEKGMKWLVTHLVRNMQVDVEVTDNSSMTPLFYALLSTDPSMIDNL